MEIAISRFHFGCVLGIVLGIIDCVFSPADGHTIVGMGIEMGIIVMGIIVMGNIGMGIIVLGIIVMGIIVFGNHTKFFIQAIRFGRL